LTERHAPQLKVLRSVRILDLGGWAYEDDEDARVRTDARAWVETDKAGKVRAVTYDLSGMQNELFDGSGDPPIPTTRDVVDEYSLRPFPMGKSRRCKWLMDAS
jgi:hypothetical protein